MVHVKRTVGYIQIILGILLIVTVISMFPKATSYVMNQHQEMPNIVMELVENNSNQSLDHKERAMLVMPIFSSMATSSHVLLCTAVIIIIMSIMMILQGVANTRTGSEDDMKPKELGKFMVIFGLIVYIITSAYFIFSEHYGSDRIEVTIYFVIILVIIIGIAALVKHHFKRINKPPVEKKPSKTQ